MSNMNVPSAPPSIVPPIGTGVTQPGNAKIVGGIDASKLQQAQMKAEQQARVLQQSGHQTNKQSECCPAMWSIVSKDEDAIIATHSVTGRVYEGTPKGFSKMLRELFSEE